MAGASGAEVPREEAEGARPGVPGSFGAIRDPRVVEERVRRARVDDILEVNARRAEARRELGDLAGDGVIGAAVEAEEGTADRGAPVRRRRAAVEDDAGAEARLRCGEATDQRAATAETDGADATAVDEPRVARVGVHLAQDRQGRLEVAGAVEHGLQRLG